MKGIIRRLIDAVVMWFSPTTKREVEYILLIAWPGRRPIVKAYKLGESWYAHEFDAISDWRIKLLPKGKVIGAHDIIEGWEPVTPNMIEFYHSA